MFTPLDILYIVLAFCSLWLTAGVFWLIWQVASIFRTVNDTVTQAQDTLCKIEDALAGIRSKFEHTSSVLGVVVDATSRVVEHVIDKKRDKKKRKEEDEEVIDVE
jgi:hypothetical protein